LARRRQERAAERIYGTAWRDEQGAQTPTSIASRAEKRDDRKIGGEMDLFHLQEEATGQVFWHPKGWTLWRAVEKLHPPPDRTRRLSRSKTPQLMERKLWEESGHWENFARTCSSPRLTRAITKKSAC